MKPAGEKMPVRVIEACGPRSLVALVKRQRTVSAVVRGVDNPCKRSEFTP